MRRSEALGLRLALWVVEALTPYVMARGDLSQIRIELTAALREETEQDKKDEQEEAA